MMEITVKVPDSLGEQLRRVEERLPEVLELGLREVLAEGVSRYDDENAILKLLASQPTPQQVLGLRPSPEVQARVSDLLARGKQGALSSAEENELERHLLLEHLVRLAKAHAAGQLARPL